MKIKLNIAKAGCPVGEIVLSDCANIRNVVSDLVLECLNIRDGYGFDADQVAKEWCGVYKTFDEFLRFASKSNTVMIAYDFHCWESCWVSFSLLGDGKVN